MATPRQIRIRILLNKGRHGIPLTKLPKIIGELQEFLEDLSQDVGIRDGSGWQGTDFRNGSLDFLAVKNAPVSDAEYRCFNESIRNVATNHPDERVSRRTRNQFAKIASPIDPDEVINMGIEKEPIAPIDPAQPLASEEEIFEWHELTKQMAHQIHISAQSKVRALASIQGIIHSVFIEAEQPHFQLRELSSKNLIRCTYTDSQYGDLAEALRTKKAVVHVYGLSTTDMLGRKIDQMEVERIEVAPALDKSFLDNFFGCAPGLSDHSQAQAVIDDTRGRG
jgi:hypothetical protein